MIDIEFTDDPIRDYDRWCEAQEVLLMTYPECDDCGEHITDIVYEVNGTLYCEDCFNDRFERNAERIAEAHPDAENITKRYHSFCTDNPYADADHWQEFQERMLECYPECCMCGDHVTETVYEINGHYYCEDCMNDEFSREAETLRRE